MHHRDGNPNNNPPDGSNWENLCVYCHDDEHSRGLLGDYFSGKKIMATASNFDISGSVYNSDGPEQNLRVPRGVNTSTEGVSHNS